MPRSDKVCTDNEEGAHMSVDRMTRRGLAATVSTVTTLGLTLWWASPAGAASQRSTTSAGNGYIIMIHATFEPHSHPMLDHTNTGTTTADQGRNGRSERLGSDRRDAR